MQRKILIEALNKCTATDNLIPGKAPPTPPRPLDPSQSLQEEKILYHITIDDLNIHEIFEHSLATMIRNRRELIKEIFSILAPHEIKAMLPESFRELKPKEVMKLCYMQLKEMPENHLTAIITCLADPSQCPIPVYKTTSRSKRSSDSPPRKSSPKPGRDRVRDRSPAYKLDKPKHKSKSPKRSSSHSNGPAHRKSTPDKKSGKDSSKRSSPSKKRSDKSPKRPGRKSAEGSNKSKSEGSDHKRLASSVQSTSKPSSKSKHHSSGRDKKQKKN